MSGLVLGIDAGTTAIKTVLVDPEGVQLGAGRAAVPVDRPAPGWAEQSMDAVWDAVTTAVRQAVATAGGADVVAIGVCGQGDGLWLVDGAGAPVRSAILWMDGRGSGTLAELEAEGLHERVWDVTGSVLFPGALAVLLRWMQAHERESLERARHHLNCKDFLRLRLTGDVATDPSDASRSIVDIRTGRYDEALLAALGIERWRHLLAPVRPSNSLCGALTSAAAAAMGLPAGIPVATGMVDVAATGVGLGAVRPGDGYSIVGTTAWHGVVSAEPVFDPRLQGFCLAYGAVPAFLRCLAPMAGTPNVDWLRELLDVDPDAFAALEDRASELKPGADGVLYLPYISGAGERAPFIDPHARAVVFGLRRDHGRATMVRAIYEGVALSAAECLAALPPVERLLLAGGASRSILWPRVLADVTGVPVELPASAEAGALGAALSASVGAGLHPTLDAAVAAGASAASLRIEPDADAHRRYVALQELFRDLRVRLREPWARASALAHTEETTTA